MNEQTFINKPIISATIATVLFLLCFTSETFTVSCISTFVLAVCFYFNKSIKITLLDILVVAVLIWEIAITFFVAGVNNVGALSRLYFFTVYYFILRLILSDRTSIGYFFCGVYVIVTVVALICTVSFGIFKEKVISSGFESLYDFKYLYRPFGELNNVWASVFLILIGLVVLGSFFLDGKKKFLTFIPFTALLYCLSVSFSRGIYISVFLLIVTISGFVVTSSMKGVIKLFCLTSLLSVCLLMYLPNRNDVQRTIKMVETVSQLRSMENRIKSVQYIIPAMEKAPFMGVGSGRYSLAVNEFVYEDGSASITDFAPNIISQLLLEKGIIGTVLWLMIYVAELILTISGISLVRDRRLQILILIFLTIIFVREMTFPTLLGDAKMLAVLAVFLSLSQNNSDVRLLSVNGKGKYGVYLSVFVPFAMMLVCYHIFMDNRIYLRSFTEKMKNEDYYNALEDSGKIKCQNIVPLLEASAYWHLFRNSDNIEYLVSTKERIREAMSFNPYDMHLVAFDAVTMYYMGDKSGAEKQLYYLASKYPHNSSYNLLFANLLYLNNKKEQSVEYFTKAVMSAPSLLESEEWKSFVENDIRIRDMISDEIKKNIYNNPSDPIELSKCGKLCYIIGDNTTAKKYLTAAAGSLPNLETPWVYLARIAKDENAGDVYSFLMKRLSLWGYNDKMLETGQKCYKSDYNSKLLSPDYTDYCLKLEIWYKVSLYGSSIIDFSIG